MAEKDSHLGSGYGVLLYCTDGGPDRQAYLKFQGVDFVTVASNNHASPTGALPFLLPASDSSNLMEAVFPIPSNRIERWVRETKTRSTGEKKEEKKRHSNTQLKEVDPHAENIASADQKPADIRYEAYLSLINYRIRNAYVRFSPPSLVYLLTDISPLLLPALLALPLPPKFRRNRPPPLHRTQHVKQPSTVRALESIAGGGRDGTSETVARDRCGSAGEGL